MNKIFSIRVGPEVEEKSRDRHKRPPARQAEVEGPGRRKTRSSRTAENRISAGQAPQGAARSGCPLSAPRPASLPRTKAHQPKARIPDLPERVGQAQQSDRRPQGLQHGAAMLVDLVEAGRVACGR